MLTICCVRWGDKFSRDYVNILYNGIKRHLSEPFRFVCVTDDPCYDEGIETVKLPEGLTGWWGKLWLFSKEFQDQCTDRIWFFDLDTLITDHLDDLAKYKGEFIILRDFYRPYGLGSGLMAWKKGFGQEIWDRWVLNGKPEVEGGDQAWIESIVCDVDKYQEIYPGEVVSYKCHAEKWPPGNARIVCFHGFPKPHECTSGWVSLMWKKDGIVCPKFGNNANVTEDVMLRNVKENVKRDLPWFQSIEAHNGTMVIVGGAPSLNENYLNLRQRQKRGQTIVSLNGTLDRLMERGIKPDFHVMMDARPENVEFVKSGHDVGYLVNAVCDKSIFEALEGKDVTVWHSFIANEDEHVKILNEYPDKPWGIIGTGNTVGLTAIVLGYFMGFRKFHLYGMDSSYEEDKHHAYEQKLNDGEAVFSVWANGKEYKCARWMMKQAENFQQIYKTMIGQGCSITAHGSGLLPDICRHMNNELHKITRDNGKPVLSHF